MVSIFNGIGVLIVDAYQQFLEILPPIAQNFINLFLISLIIVVYSILIWKFYRFISKRNLIELNLRQYGRSDHVGLDKIIAASFYTLEYLIILPFMVFLWFSVFTIFLIVLTNGIELNTILVISATIIAAIRMTAYYKEDLSKDVAKLLPFTLLGVSITQGGVFSFDKILGQIFAIPNFFGDIFSYLIFIFVIEFMLRSIETLFVTTGIEDIDEAMPLEE